MPYSSFQSTQYHTLAAESMLLILGVQNEELAYIACGSLCLTVKPTPPL